MSVAAIAPIPIGTLMKKIDSQLTCSVSTPPTSGPIATAAPIVAPQMPNAVPRSRPWNVAASSESDVANIAAPPMPWSAARELRNVGDVATPHSSDAVVNRAEPVDEHEPAPEAGRRASRWSAAARRATSA